MVCSAACDTEEIGVVGDDHPALASGEGELIAIRSRTQAGLLGGGDIDTVLPQGSCDVRVDRLVEMEADAFSHVAAALRASPGVAKCSRRGMPSRPRRRREATVRSRRGGRSSRPSRHGVPPARGRICRRSPPASDRASQNRETFNEFSWLALAPDHCRFQPFTQISLAWRAPAFDISWQLSVPWCLSWALVLAMLGLRALQELGGLGERLAHS